MSLREPWSWRVAARQALALLAFACLAAAAANHVRPAGLSWRAPVRGPVWKEGDEVFLRLTLAETVRVVDQEKWIVLDARRMAAWRNGRIPGAWPLPIEEAEAALEPLRPLLADPDEPMLVYCGRAGCDEGVRLARFLRDRGYRRVAIYPDGYAAWRAEGLPTERSDAR